MGERPKRELTQFGELLLPREAMEPILAKPVRTALLAWLTEIFASDELAAVGIGPRRRAIFDGPPGVGKTTLAHHLSARLGLPMLAVRPERVISKWVGQTGEQIGNLFDVVAAGYQADDADVPQPIVMFLDEFDGLGTTRREADTSAGDERNAFVNTLLQRLEQHDGFVIAATNFGGRIDPALWRRFDVHITLELPGEFERGEILRRYLAPFGLPREALRLLAAAFESASPALIRQFCEQLKRSLVIGPKLGHDMGRDATLDRLVASVQPHPTLGKPPMWASGADHARDRAIAALPWPLPRAADVVEDVAAPLAAGGTVVPLRRGDGARK